MEIREDGNFGFNVTKEQRETAKKNNIDYRNMYNRIYNLGWEVERAITEPVKEKLPMGERYAYGILEKLKKNGINYNTFRSRIHMGWDLEKASTLRTMNGQDRGACIIKNNAINGKVYAGGLTAEHYRIGLKNGISKSNVTNRVNALGWSIEKAITEPLAKYK